MSNIIPTLGRTVYYKSYGTPNGEYLSTDRAAIITEVVDSEKGIVSLCVLNPEGMFFNKNVSQGDLPGNWQWMPFQILQAQKTEELQETLRKVIPVPQIEVEESTSCKSCEICSDCSLGSYK